MFMFLDVFFESMLFLIVHYGCGMVGVCGWCSERNKDWGA